MGGQTDIICMKIQKYKM